MKTALEIGQAFIDELKSGMHTGNPVNYYEYIQSYLWKVIAERTKQVRGYRCQLCNISGYVTTLNVHHNTYERLGHEKDSDLLVLCADCHEIFHTYKKPQANKIELSEEEIRKVLHYNGVSPKNNDPWDYYSIGKQIVLHIIDGYNEKLYDKYNGVNIDIVFRAIDRQIKELEENDG